MKILCLVILCLFASVDGKESFPALDFLPSKDKERIEQLFSYLVQRDSLGYVLFGDTKAAAFASIPVVCRYALVSPAITKTPLKYQRRLKQSWEVWKRYEHRFHHPNIIVCEEHECFKESAFLNIFFIDKAKLHSLLNKHHEDFTEVLGEKFSPEGFISKLEKKKKLRPLIRGDEQLLGLILGFGKESSLAFKNMNFEDEDSCSFRRVGVRPKGCCITPVSFKGNPESQEVKALVEAYTKEIMEIENIFKSPSFLSSTLEKFCSQKVD